MITVSDSTRPPYQGCDEPSNRWKPRRLSPVTSFLVFMAVLLWAFTGVSAVLGIAHESTVEELIWRSIGPVSVFFLPFAVACSVLAVLSELVSRFRIPPPTWRVREELIMALGDLGLLDLDRKDTWRGVLWIAPFGGWNRKARAFSMLFDVRTVKATPDLFRHNLPDAIAGFRGVQGLTVEPWRTKRGYRRCFKLTLFYAVDSYQRALDEMKPW